VCSSDLALMGTVSRDYLAYSAADVIAHCIEGYFTATVQPHLQSRLVESLVATVIETTETLLADPGHYAARAEFAWAATLALNGTAYVGTAGMAYPNHMIEHALSALFNVPHGAGLSVVMPAWMRWYQDRNPAQFERFAR
jgi:alcohol dehydrogenase YqhD (iron-dependent ADH family)